ncbi:hypothetical protein D3C87_1192680 [compost metagenome]
MTSHSGSPWVATTLFSLTATVTPQPVPQKRQGALSHFRRVRSLSVTKLAASAPSGMPPTEAVAATAVCLIKSRRVTFIDNLRVHVARILVVLVDQGGRQHAVQLMEERQMRRDGA